MSYTKAIGFGLDQNNPKGLPVPLTPNELTYLHRLGVPPRQHNLKTLLGDNVEPEPKLILESPKGFSHFRNIINASSNAFLIPGQVYEDKNPLTSILLDSVSNSFPTAILDRGNYTLRYRAESCPLDGRYTSGDFNEKSGLKGARSIGGCLDRYEREIEQRPGEAPSATFSALKTKYRERGDFAYCNNIAFNDLRVFGGYQAARNEIGFALKHPKDKVLFVFEACEDFWHTLHHDMATPMSKMYELEFEAKQVWGELPSRARSRAGFKEYLYETMTAVRDCLFENIPGAQINLKSKAEITKEHLEATFGFERESLSRLGLTSVFEKVRPTGYSSDFSAVQFSLMMGDTLDNTLSTARNIIHQNSVALHIEKQKYNAAAPVADISFVGFADRDVVLPARERGSRLIIPVAAVA